MDFAKSCIHVVVNYLLIDWQLHFFGFRNQPMAIITIFINQKNNHFYEKLKKTQVF